MLQASSSRLLSLMPTCSSMMCMTGSEVSGSNSVLFAFQSQNVAGEVDHGNLHTEAESQIRDLIFPGVLGGYDLALRSPITRILRGPKFRPVWPSGLPDRHARYPPHQCKGPRPRNHCGYLRARSIRLPRGKSPEGPCTFRPFLPVLCASGSANGERLLPIRPTWEREHRVEKRVTNVSRPSFLSI